MKYSLSELMLIPVAMLLVGSGLLFVFSKEPGPSSEPVEPPLPDFAAMADVKKKKLAFFDFMRPLIRSANDGIREEQRRLVAITAQIDAGQELSKADATWLSALALRYRVEGDPVTDPAQLRQLKKRVRPFPASLVLAQAANESGWGTARFARKGNNFFGIWCWARDCGLVPEQRNEGAQHEVAAFSSVRAGVEYYLLTLNSHPAYQLLRDIRDRRRANGKPPSGSALAAGLINYSERREAYVEEIRSMISFNKLETYNR